MYSQLWARAKRTHLWAIALSAIVAIAVGVIPPATAQIPGLPTLQPPNLVSPESDNRVVSGWVHLDGRRLFQIAAPNATLPERLEIIQQRLAQITQDYFQKPAASLNVESREQKTMAGKALPVIYVNNQYLLTVTEQDANRQQLEPSTWASQLSELLQQKLQRAARERQPEFLVRHSLIAAGMGLTMILLSWLLYRASRRSSKRQAQPVYPDSSARAPIANQLNEQQQRNMKEVHRRLFQLAQTGIWGGGIFFILGLFPYTRSLQLWIFTILQFPVKFGIVGLATYVAIRLSYALIDRFTSAFVSSSALLTPETSERLQLRVSTISSVTKGIATVALVITGIIVALSAMGVNIGPLLAGAGLVGVAVSLASQSLIKDAINGFLIIVEDQYALGDVINVGNVGGLVETLNLRITQLRDAEGRLITIPNSEIKVVANLSSRWSQADINIPVAYQADVDQALKLIESVGLEMCSNPQWQEQILETPQVLGVDNFGDRGLMIRVWIKTQPLKQWAVAREYRRRLKIALDKAGIEIPFPQAIWLHESGQSHSDGKGFTSSREQGAGSRE